MPYMENAANERRNLTAPRNRIFEDVDTQQAFLAGQAALQAADKKSAISEEKAMRAQAVSGRHCRQQTLQRFGISWRRILQIMKLCSKAARSSWRRFEMRGGQRRMPCWRGPIRSAAKAAFRGRRAMILFFMPQIFPQPGTQVQRRRIRQIPLCSERLRRQPSFRRHRRTMHGYQAGRIPFSNRATSRPTRGIH